MATQLNLQKTVKRRRITKVRSQKATNKQWKQIKRPTVNKTKVPTIKTKVSATLDLNVNFFNALDGVYNSYWLGKLINMLVTQGKKKVVARHTRRSLAVLKYARTTNPLLLLLEIIDKIKPSFRLRNYIVRRVQVKEYPIVTFRSRQLIIALHWLKLEIRNTHQLKSSLADRIANVLLNFTSTPKNNLVKKRVEYTKRIVAGQFNIRYTWK